MADASGKCDVGKLRRMSHVELQTLAKTLQIKANQKTGKLRDAIMDKMMEDEPESSQAMPTVINPPASSPKQIDEAIAATTAEVENPDVVQKLRRRTYDVTPDMSPFVAIPKKDIAVALSPFLTPPSGEQLTSSGESVYRSAQKTQTPNIKEAPKMNSPLPSERRVSPRVKTPKFKGIDQAVGQTPVRKPYNLRSTAANKPQKSQIPRPIKNDRARNRTPNFKKIHQKAFDKMESIDVYESKKQQLRDNYKSLTRREPKAKLIAAASVISQPPGASTEPDMFKPSVISTKQINLNFMNMKGPAPKTPKKPREVAMMPLRIIGGAVSNKTMVPSKKVFNLEKSLARKLGYQPYTGPLVRLDDGKAYTGSFVKPSGNITNDIRDKYRTENKDFLKGVRRNRRLDLQLKMRGILD